MRTRKGYLFRRGDKYYAAWYVGGRKIVKATGQTAKAKAEEVLAGFMQPFLVLDEIRTLETVQARIDGGRRELAALEDQKAPPLALEQAWRTYLADTHRPDSGERTLRDYEACYRKLCRWLHQTHPSAGELRDVTSAMAGEYAAHLLAGKASPCTYNKHINAVSLVFRVLSKKAKLLSNPWDDVCRKKKNTHSRRELTIEELKKVCSAATGDLRLLFALGIYTGMRMGDCATLRWGEVDLRRRYITRIPNKTLRRGAKPAKIPIHHVLHDMLAEIPTSHHVDYVLPDTAKLYYRAEYALSKKIQDHFTASGIWTAQPGTGKESRSVDPKSNKPIRGTGKRAVVEVGFHSLRHTFVSLSRQNNSPLAVVESIVGHSSPAMTQHHTHVSEEAATKAVAGLPTLFGYASATPAPPAVDIVPKLIVRAIAEGMTAKNWRQKRDEILRSAT